MPLDPRVKRFLDVLAAGKPPNALDTNLSAVRLPVIGKRESGISTTIAESAATTTTASTGSQLPHPGAVPIASGSR